VTGTSANAGSPRRRSASPPASGPGYWRPGPRTGWRQQAFLIAGPFLVVIPHGIDALATGRIAGKGGVAGGGAGSGGACVPVTPFRPRGLMTPGLAVLGLRGGQGNSMCLADGGQRSALRISIVRGG
jgi:hypothetical protein